MSEWERNALAGPWRPGGDEPPRPGDSPMNITLDGDGEDDDVLPEGDDSDGDDAEQDDDDSQD